MCICEIIITNKHYQAIKTKMLINLDCFAIIPTKIISLMFKSKIEDYKTTTFCEGFGLYNYIIFIFFHIKNKNDIKQ